MAAARAVPKLGFTPLSSEAKASARPWVALLLPQWGTSPSGAGGGKVGEKN